MSTELRALQLAALHADMAFDAALVRRFGKNASAARRRPDADPEVAALARQYRAASSAWHAARQAAR